MLNHLPAAIIAEISARAAAKEGWMKLPQTGGCQWGAIRYEITEAPQLIYKCHCVDCQRLRQRVQYGRRAIKSIEREFLLSTDYADFTDSETELATKMHKRLKRKPVTLHAI